MINNDMKPHKFYVIEFIPKKYKMRDYNDVLIKFGITKNMDVLERFNPYFDERYKDFHYKVKFSKVFSNKSKAEAIESYWLQERFPNPGPNKVWIEDYLQCEHKQKYNDTGITEIRLLKKYQLAEVLKELYNTLSIKDKQFKAEAKKQYV
tara:strand:+ start:99 stop:548 length:450 start_codon:yes stop_codon:yes gene_type:complete